MNHRRASLYCAVAAVVLSGLMPIAAVGQGSGTRLHQLDQSRHMVLKGEGPVSSLVDVMLQSSYDQDLASVTDLASDISANETAYMSQPQEFPLTDVDVVVAFDAWRNLISDPERSHTSPVDLHMYRMFLSGLAPSLISKDHDGLVSLHLSPVEAFYLFDFMISHGTIPPSELNPIRRDIRGYRAAYRSYVDRVSESQRQADLRKIVDTYLLKKTD